MTSAIEMILEFRESQERDHANEIHQRIEELEGDEPGAKAS